MLWRSRESIRSFCWLRQAWTVKTFSSLKTMFLSMPSRSFLRRRLARASRLAFVAAPSSCLVRILYGCIRKSPVTRHLIVLGDIPCSLAIFRIDCRGFLRILSLIFLIATGVRQNLGLPGCGRSSVDWVHWNLSSVRLINTRLSFISFPA